MTRADPSTTGPSHIMPAHRAWRSARCALLSDAVSLVRKGGAASAVTRAIALIIATLPDRTAMGRTTMSAISGPAALVREDRDNCKRFRSIGITW